MNKEKYYDLIKDNYINNEVVIGIRLEDIYVEDIFIKFNLDICFKLRIEIKEFMGVEIYVYLKLGENMIIIRFDSKNRINVGDDLIFLVDNSRVYIFDKEIILVIR